MDTEIDIEYLDINNSNPVIYRWLQATLRCGNKSIKVVDLNGTVLYNDDFSQLDSVKLITLTGGQPARYEFISIYGSHIITIRPRRQMLLPLRQVRELKAIAQILNSSSNRTLVDLRKLRIIYILTWLSLIWLTITVAIMIVVIL